MADYGIVAEKGKFGPRQPQPEFTEDVQLQDPASDVIEAMRQAQAERVTARGFGG